MQELELANILTAAQWVRSATADGAELVGVIGLSLPNADGGRLSMLLSTPKDVGCRQLLALLREIVAQADAGLATEVHLGEGTPDWYREGREPTPEDLRLRPDPWGGGESPPDRPPAA